MIITVVTMRVVQVAVDQIIDVIAVRHRLMAAAGAMHMVGRMGPARVGGGTSSRIDLADFHHVLLHRAVSANVMQVIIVQIVDVVTMLDPGVLTIGTVLVIVVFVGLTHHSSP